MVWHFSDVTWGVDNSGKRLRVMDVLNIRTGTAACFQTPKHRRCPHLQQSSTKFSSNRHFSCFYFAARDALRRGRVRRNARLRSRGVRSPFWAAWPGAYRFVFVTKTPCVRPLKTQQLHNNHFASGSSATLLLSKLLTLISENLWDS